MCSTNRSGTGRQRQQAPWEGMNTIGMNGVDYFLTDGHGGFGSI